MANPHNNPRFKNLSSEELAQIEARFRERRQRRPPGPDAPGARGRRRKRFIKRLLFWAMVVLVVLIYCNRNRPTAPTNHGTTLPLRDDLPATPLGDQARLPSGCEEVAPASYASVLGLAEGSELARRTQLDYVATTGLPVEIRNSIGMRFRLVPPGSFVMGSPATEVGRGPDELEHVVAIRQPYYLGKYEVTQELWTAVMGPDSNRSGFAGRGENLPVEEVTWQMCQDFCRRLADLEQLSAGSYRLPTEAEWEYACRAGTHGPYYTGSGWRDLQRAADFKLNNDRSTVPVGRRAPNAWGLYDMHGNVWEWCQDRFARYETPDETDPIQRVIRGGNWHAGWLDCRAASRFRLPPDSHGNICGFRILRVIPRRILKEPPQP